MSRLSYIKDGLESRKESLNKKKTENEILENQIVESQNKIGVASEKLEIGKDALAFLEQVANSRRNSMKDKIQSIITEAVRFAFGNNYSVELSYSTKNNRSFMDIVVVKKTEKGEVKRTMEGIGGSVSDSVAIPLRLMVIMGSSETSRVCILDEGYKHVDRRRIELVAEFIRDVSHKLGIQIIMCSHHTAMIDKADRVYKIWDDNGVARQA